MSFRLQAPIDFVSSLAKEFLGRQNGALGYIGHINTAWSTSFQWRGAGPQTQTFEAAFECLLNTDRIGAALEPFSHRYAELISDLSANLTAGEEHGEVNFLSPLSAKFCAKRGEFAKCIHGQARASSGMTKSLRSFKARATTLRPSLVR